MAEVINLNKARKARAKAEAKTRAEQNRAAHGVTKAEKQKSATERKLAERKLDQHERE
jgi:hypothetical protein